MLGVHPPHTSIHTWRDFFIHIATIVVGLCIAVGLFGGLALARVMMTRRLNAANTI